MPTIYHEQISTALEAEIAAKNEIIEKLHQQINQLTRERNLIKTKWEILNDEKQTEIQITKKFYEDDNEGWNSNCGHIWAIDGNVVYSGPDSDWVIVSIVETLGFKVKITTLCHHDTEKELHSISSHDE